MNKTVHEKLPELKGEKSKQSQTKLNMNNPKLSQPCCDDLCGSVGALWGQHPSATIPNHPLRFTPVRFTTETLKDQDVKWEQLSKIKNLSFSLVKHQSNSKLHSTNSNDRLSDGSEQRLWPRPPPNTLPPQTPLVIITARPAAGLAPSTAPVSPPPAPAPN